MKEPGELPELTTRGVAYVFRLDKLNNLIKNGGAGSNQEEHIRDRLDMLWNKLTELDKKQVKKYVIVRNLRNRQ